MQKQAQLEAQPEVRSLKFQVKIKNADLLGDALNDILSTRTSGRIDAYGRGFKLPSPTDYLATIYSSTVILADQASAPKGEYIYTMDDVVFSTEVKSVGNEGKFTEKESNIALNGGWVLQNGEYVLVIFTKKKEQHSRMVDMQKMQGRTLYNATLTRLTTQVIGKDVLGERNFNNKILVGDYPEVSDTFNAQNQKLFDQLRGKKVGDTSDGTDYDAQFGSGKAKKQPAVAGDAPSFVKENYFLYDKKEADVIFAYQAPGEKPKPFNPQTDPAITFRLNYPNFLSEETVTEQGKLPYKKPAQDSNPGYVDVVFTNIPKNMPKRILGDIFSNIYGYMKSGLEAKELAAKPNQIYSGNAVFKEDPSHPDESLFEQNANKVKALLAEIKDLYMDNKEYKVDFDNNMPMPKESKGVNKNILKYLYELEVYVKHLKRNLPLSLAELDRIIKEDGESFVNPKNVNLLKILKKQQ